MKTHVVTTTPATTLAGALDLMDLYQVNGVPVVDDSGHLVGMLTERDVMLALASTILLDALPMSGVASSSSRIIGNRMVGEFMSRPALSVAEESDLRAAARLMLARGLKRLPVTSGDGAVAGVLNRVDVLQALFEGEI